MDGPEGGLESKEEILRRLREELARFGCVGGVRLEGRTVTLLHPAGRRSAALGTWADHWEALDESLRRTQVIALARTLARPSSLPTSNSSSRVSGLIGLGLGVLTVLILVAVARAFGFDSQALGSLLGLRQSPDAPVVARRSAPNESPALEDAAQRSALVCATTRARVVRGATVTLADADGWVVEYMAFGAPDGPPLHTSPALRPFVEDPSAPDGSRYVWPEEPHLSRTPTSEDRVRVLPETISGGGLPSRAGLRITFSGALVDAYFSPETRGAYFHIASALTDALGATHAGLYARCADGATHHLGSWFRGQDDGQAVAALVYTLGTFAEPLHLDSLHSRAPNESSLDRAFAFSQITRVTSLFDRPLVAGLIGRQGGMVMGRPGTTVTLTFPFDDGNRASRFSRDVARVTGLGGG